MNLATYHYRNSPTVSFREAVAKTHPGSAIVTTTRFDGLGRRRQIALSTIFELHYQYDAVGNVKKIAEEFLVGLGNCAPTQTNNCVACHQDALLEKRDVDLEYDDIYRLKAERTTIDGAVANVLYSYDEANNRSSKTANGNTIHYVYNNLNQLTSSDNGITYSYDEHGNRIGRTEAGSTISYQYDRENRLTRVQDGAELHQYDYDYRTRRVGRFENQTHADVVFSGGTSVSEFSAGSLTPDVEYIRGNDWGGGVGGILYSVRGGTASINHYNNRGDVIAKTTPGGALSYAARYESFSSRTKEVGSTPDRQKGNTKEEDPTGLLNEGFRYRDIETGSFITRDPLGFVDGPNMYTYVRQNPWTMFDPLGLTGDRVDPDGYKWSNRDHHIVPRAVARDAGWDKGAKAIFDSSKIKTPNGHNYSKHGKYNREVSAEMAEFISEKAPKGLSSLSARDQKALANEFVNKLKNTDNGFIKGFNKAVPKGAGTVNKWYNNHGRNIVLKSTGKIASKNAPIINGIASIAKVGGKTLKGVPIVSGLLVVGASVAGAKTLQETNDELFVSVTNADLVKMVADPLEDNMRELVRPSNNPDTVYNMMDSIIESWDQ